jgi:hypothetical protein
MTYFKYGNTIGELQEKIKPMTENNVHCINTRAQIKSDIPHTHFECKLLISAEYNMKIT